MVQTPRGPTDRALAKLYEALAAPHWLSQVGVELLHVLPQVSNQRHRGFLEGKFRQIEKLQSSPGELTKIANELELWSNLEFPLKKK